jgi:hypothetical protein
MAVDSHLSRIQETEPGVSQVHSHLGLHSEFQTSLDYIARPCLKKEKQKNSE